VPAPNLKDSCYQTSDLAAVEDRAVFLRGRQTDQINVAGRKVSPESIERVLACHTNIRECLIFGIPSPDTDRTEEIVACVTVKGEVGAGVLKEHLLAQLPAWQVPRHWWFVPSLETNARGKLARAEWRSRYLQEKAGSTR